MRRVDPPKAVQVLHDGAWHPGLLEAWRRCARPATAPDMRAAFGL